MAEATTTTYEPYDAAKHGLPVQRRGPMPSPDLDAFWEQASNGGVVVALDAGDTAQKLGARCRIQCHPRKLRPSVRSLADGRYLVTAVSK